MGGTVDRQDGVKQQVVATTELTESKGSGSERGGGKQNQYQ